MLAARDSTIAPARARETSDMTSSGLKGDARRGIGAVCPASDFYNWRATLRTGWHPRRCLDSAVGPRLEARPQVIIGRMDMRWCSKRLWGVPAAASRGV